MKPNRIISFWKILKKIFLYLFIFQFLYIILLRWINPPITITQVVSFVRGNGFKRNYVSLSNISRNAKLAVIAGEDQLFANNNGFDVKAIKLAVKYNKTHKNKTRGASTISQQVAKNVFLWQGGGFFRKGLEVYFTFMIETFWNKKRILEVYLNVSEMGKGVFGVEAASNIYYNKTAALLSKNEAAQIAASLPNPIIFTVRPLSKYVSNRSVHLLEQMDNLDGDEDIEAIIK